LLGEVAYCPDALLKYRVHVGNVSQSGERRATHAAERAALAKLLTRNKLPWLAAFCDDLATAQRQGLLTDAQYAAHRAKVENCIKLDRASLAWLTGNLFQRIRAAWTLYRHDGPEPKMSSSALYLLAVGVWPGLGEVWERLKARRRRE